MIVILKLDNMKLDIPFFSQLDTQVPEELRRSVCAIACLKMICEYKIEPVDFLTLLKEAEWIGQKDKAGWVHEILVRVLRNHNVLAYRQEFVAHTIDTNNQSAVPADHTSDFITQGISKIKKSIDNGNPVMVSVKAGFSENKDDHMILVIGYEEDSLIVFDPILHTEQNPKIIPLNTFLNFWKKLAIFVE